MKFGIFVCLLVVVACREVTCHTVARITGNCDLEDIPKQQRNACINLKCEKSDGGIELSATTCAPVLCPDGTPSGPGENDLTKTYPHCCTYRKCN